MSIDSVEELKPQQLFTNGRGEIWFVESYFSRPSVTLKRVFPESDEPIRCGGAVGSTILSEFIKLDVGEQK